MTFLIVSDSNNHFDKTLLVNTDILIASDKLNYFKWSGKK